MFYLNTTEQLFLFVEQLDQLQVCLPYSRLLTGITILAVFQNLRWNSNKTSLFLPIFSQHKALSMLVLNKNNVRLTVYALVKFFKDDDDRKMFDVHGYEYKVIKKKKTIFHLSRILK